MKVKWCGTVSYSEGLRLQEEAFQHCRVQQQATFLGLEHEPIITLGKRLHDHSEIKYQNANIEICFTDRGGEATLHSPGQLVVYPVLNIRSMGMGVREYIYVLEESLMALLKDYGINSDLIVGEPGVYTARGKIAFLGIRVRRGITQHGLALNVANDLSLFNCIRPCGKEQQPLDSLLLNGINASPKMIFEQLSIKLRQAFCLTNKSDMEDSRLLDFHTNLGS